VELGQQATKWSDGCSIRYRRRQISPRLGALLSEKANRIQKYQEIGVMRNKQRVVIGIIGISLLAFSAGCKKKVPAATVAPPPPAPAKAEVAPPPKAPAIAEFIAEPGTIDRGQSAVLRWRVNDASDVEINQGIGAVSSAGDRRVFPDNATTYTLLAKGPGGSATASATLNVTVPPPPPPVTAPAAPAKTIGERLANEVQDAYFDYDKSDLRDDARSALTNDAGWQKNRRVHFTASESDPVTQTASGPKELGGGGQ
jgi:hypothetical protein